METLDRPIFRTPTYDGDFGVSNDMIVELKIDKTTKEFNVISDCVVYVDHSSLSDKGKRLITFKGYYNGDPFQDYEFTLPAEVCADPRKFKATLINVFGPSHKTTKLTYDIIQTINPTPTEIRRIEVPGWDGNIPLIPGLNLLDNIEFDLQAETPAMVYGGDLNEAKTVLVDALDCHPFAPLPVVFALGAPVFARYFPEERFGLALWGRTGGYKTSLAQICSAFYGMEFTMDKYLLKADSSGGSVIAFGRVAAGRGWLLLIYDNVKTVDPKSNQRYVSNVSSWVEGADKKRAEKDGDGMRESKDYLVSPFITGEIRPEESSTTARVFNIDWLPIMNTTALGRIQNHPELLPVLGYNWLKYLSEHEIDISGFTKARTNNQKVFATNDYVNPGRLATIYVLMRTVWSELCKSPLKDVFVPRTGHFMEILDSAIEQQAEMVNQDTEISKFIEGVNELRALNPSLFQSEGVTGTNDRIIGKYTGEGLFLLPAATLAELGKLKVFTQIPTEDSITKALDSNGFLIRDPDGKRRKTRLRINGTRVEGWHIKIEGRPHSSVDTKTTASA